VVYKERVYTVIPGRINDFTERLQVIAAPILERHGGKVIGIWRTVIGQSNQLTFILAYDDLGHRERVWDAFGRDPEWVEKGPTVFSLVERINNRILRPVPGSPLQ